MKYLITLPILLLLTVTSFATHIVGGDLHYEYLGNDEYKIILKVYRDCGTSSTGFDNIADVGVYLGTDLQFTVPMNLSNAQTSFLPVDTGDPCLNAPPDLCVAEAIYEEIVEIPYQPGTFHLAYQRCCRNTTLVNCESNDDIGMTVTTQIPDQDVWGENTTPGFVNFPPVVICLNEPFVFDHSATEPDGDSLVYKFCNPLLTNVAGFEINTPGPPPYPLLEFYPEYNYEYPLDADPAFSIDPQTGLLTGTPTQLGQYVVGICVEEWRNGELMTTTNRDFQFNIALCSQDIVASIVNEDPCEGLTYTFENNSTGELWEWDFGDETTDLDVSTEFEPTYTYQDSGMYVVTLITNPGFACADTTSVDIYAYDPLEIDFELIDDYCDEAVWHYEFESSGTYTSFATIDWDFDGGDPGSGNTENTGYIAWSEPGFYDVTLTVEDHNCIAVVSEQIEVTPSPIAQIGEQTEFCAGLTVSFTNLSQNATEFNWDFGTPLEDDISLEAEPTWTYTDYGVYQVLLIADPETECEDQDTLTVIVLPEDPIEFDYSITPPELCDTTDVVFMNFLGTGANVVTWSMGDGNSVEGDIATYQYEQPGEYTITISAEQTFCDYKEVEETLVFYGAQAPTEPLKVPNVFSPNADTKNDRFRVFYQGESDNPNFFPVGYNVFDMVLNYHMRVYDRWGVLIYDSEQHGNHWDGQYLGKDVSEGTYYYIVTYQRACIDDAPVTETGEVELLRK